MKILNQFIDGDYVIIEYENGTTVKSLIVQETGNQVIEVPNNPLMELQKENEEMKKQIADLYYELLSK